MDFFVHNKFLHFYDPYTMNKLVDQLARTNALMIFVRLWWFWIPLRTKDYTFLQVIGVKAMSTLPPRLTIAVSTWTPVSLTPSSPSTTLGRAVNSIDTSLNEGQAIDLQILTP